MTQARHPERLRAFIGALAELIDGHPREDDLLHRGGSARRFMIIECGD
jgi:hypothetical protein